MTTRRRLLGLTAVVLLSVGGIGLTDPPGLFGFLATSCGETGDCANYAAPVFASALASLLGGLLVLVVVSSVGIERWRETRTGE